jgi:hypothetical protein
MAGSIEQQIKVKIDALVSGLKEVQKLQTEIKGLESVASKKLSINTSSIESGLSKVTALFRQFSSNADSSIGGIEKTLGTLGLSAGSLAGPLGIALGAITALGAAAIGTGAAIFELVNKSAEVGEKIHDTAQQAGLTAETISALAVAYQQAGKPVDDMGANLAKFSKQLISAAQGDKDLRAELAFFGIDGKTAYKDVDGALDQFLKRFNQLPESAQKNAAAATLFKDKTGSLIPVFLQAGGGLEKLKHEADGMGALWTQEAADAADAMRDLETKIGQEVKGITNHMGIELLPAVKGVLEDIDTSLTKNKDDWKDWSEKVTGFVFAVKAAFAGGQALDKREFLEKVFDPVGNWKAFLGGAIAQADKDVSRLDSKGDRTTRGIDNAVNAWQRDNAKAGAGPDLINKPDKATRGKSAAELLAESNLKLAQQDLAQAEIIAKEANARNKIAYDENLRDLESFSKKAVDIENARYQAETKVFEKERAAAANLKGNDKKEAEKAIETKEKAALRITISR